jgi:hypothetical protein
MKLLYLLARVYHLRHPLRAATQQLYKLLNDTMYEAARLAWHDIRIGACTRGKRTTLTVIRVLDLTRGARGAEHSAYGIVGSTTSPVYEPPASKHNAAATTLFTPYDEDSLLSLQPGTREALPVPYELSSYALLA